MRSLLSRAGKAGYLPAGQTGIASNFRAGRSGGEIQGLEAEIHSASPTRPLVNEAAIDFGAGPRVAHGGASVREDASFVV